MSKAELVLLIIVAIIVMVTNSIVLADFPAWVRFPVNAAYGGFMGYTLSYLSRVPRT